MSVPVRLDTVLPGSMTFPPPPVTVPAVGAAMILVFGVSMLTSEAAGYFDTANTSGTGNGCSCEATVAFVTVPATATVALVS